MTPNAQSRSLAAHTIQCATCRQWIPCPKGRLALDRHVRDTHPAVAARIRAQHDAIMSTQE
jgi:hypothetical protein